MSIALPISTRNGLNNFYFIRFDQINQTEEHYLKLNYISTRPLVPRGLKIGSLNIGARSTALPSCTKSAKARLIVHHCFSSRSGLR